MTLRTAKEHFEAALAVAEREEDKFGQSIAAGLIDLSAALQLGIQQIRTELSTIKSKVS